MNVSYRWLRDLVPGLELDPAAVAEHLALRGAPVEGMNAQGDKLRDVVVARVVTSGQHPNADRLSLCTVDGGSGVVQVVCGAPNVRAGGWYPFVPVGATLPGDVQIRKAKIRGEYSEGMLCSARELGLGADHAGILEMEGEFEPGQSFVQAMGLDDVTLDVEITANRGDLLSHVGVARELASRADGRVVLPDIPGDPHGAVSYLEDPSEARAGAVSIRIEDPDLCSRYMGAVVRRVKVGPSPQWLQARLRGAGARPINNVVDATNYVMLELGQPLHAFDLAKLEGSSIVVRRAGASEASFTTLDDEERRLTTDMLMICDATRPVALAGVMGGLDSEVDETTTDVLLECAMFDARSVRGTRRALAMSTDASYRFERGVDPEGMRRAVERTVALILSTAGGSLDGAVLDVNPGSFEPATVPLRLTRIQHVLGVPIGARRVEQLLSPLGFEVTGESDGTLLVRVPGFRSYDVTREIDLIEEVARTHGYDEFPSELGPYRPGTVPDHPMFQLEDELRRALAAAGFLEAHTPAFVAEGEGDVEVANPLNAREPFMRRALLPSLLRRVEYNLARGNRDVRLFEIGTSFHRAGPGEPPREETHLAVVMTGLREPPHWSTTDAPCTVWDLKGVLEDASRRAYRGAATLAPASAVEGPWDADVAFEVRDGDDGLVGVGGRILPDAMDLPVWAGDVWGLEITLPADVGSPPVAHYAPLPQFPGVERDLALVVPDTVPAASALSSIRRGAGELLEDVTLFDLYRGQGVPEGSRSVAFRLRFRARDRTLKDAEVDRVMASVLARLKEDLGVETRG